MKLYELSAAYQQALDRIEAAEEDFTDQQWDLLAGIEDAFNTKIESVGKFIKSLEADAAAVKVERQRLAGREKTLERKVAWLKRYLLQTLRGAGKEKIKGELLTVSLRKAPISCAVVDETAVPAAFRREVTEVKIDRQGIIAHFKQTGELLPGVEMVTDRRTVSIR